MVEEMKNGNGVAVYDDVFADVNAMNLVYRMAVMKML